ncbi:hypothetical protein EIP91_002671 [Steccherinum ochraceum]|uniref:Glucose-methanol-choline oxidoreductase N-terminal domain-containing protein n=1 Tax=Steccherinum ochraceum TaxID=92696 RepID=A0A4V2MWA2_9APHY|nr:hypothetical protein EIP91_002671 [Steccherinum ochraceum]
MWHFKQSDALRKPESLHDSYDFVVVGGGNAGCVLARRLTDQGRHTVLLVEKGDAGDSWTHRTPLPSFHHFSDGRHSTAFESARDEQLGRSVTLISGLGLGGSTRINGGQYTCGVPGEYNAWAQDGNVGWAYNDLKQFFKMSETWIGPVPREFHGAHGKWHSKGFAQVKSDVSPRTITSTMVECEIFGISSLISKDGTPLPHSKEQEDSTDPQNLPDFAVLSMKTSIGDPRTPGAELFKGLYVLNVALLRPKSSGRVLLRSTNPLEPPQCETRYLTHPDDYHALRAGLRTSLAVSRTMREGGYDISDLSVPDVSSDETLDAYVRKHAMSMMHYSSTCRMAPRFDAKPGVVDASLRVYGVQGLRIADASIIPVAPAAHPQAMVYAIAEKCADMMLKDASK